MVNAVENITIFNLRYDSTERRDKLVPTYISGVSYHHVAGVNASSSGQGGSNRTETNGYQIRIPVSATIQDGRGYVSEAEYAELSDDDLSGYWTLQKGCYILFDRQLGEDESVETVEDLRGISENYITVTEYADNTRRGTDAVKHWRIGGA